MDIINMDTNDKDFSSKMEVGSHNAKSVLLTEFSNWSQKRNNPIKLLKDSICDDGRICLQFSMGANNNFTLYCPSEYPSYEDHFFVEATTALQFWCNALNEFILDADILLTLDTILEKASSLYHKKSNRSPCVSSSESDADGEIGDEFMVVDGNSQEAEEWEHILCQKKKRWRFKKAELRAATKQPKTSDMFDGNVKDHPKQVFSNSAASVILTNDLVAIMESKHYTGINAEPIDDNIYKWAVFLSSFDAQGKLNQDLQHLYHKYGYNYVQLQLDFTMDLYPFYPPVVKVVRPRLQGSMMLRVASMDMLKLSHWNPARDMKSVLHEIKDYLSTWARLDLNSERNDLQRFPQGAYIEMENYLLWLAWVSEIPSRAHRRFPEVERETLTHVPDTDKKKGLEKSLFPAGTGYSSSFHKGWDINAYLAAQKEKDKQIECVLQKILQELRRGSLTNLKSDTKLPPVDPTEDLFIVLEASTLVPFLELKLQVDSFFEICQHTAVYRCVVDIISEIAAKPKLVGLLWTLPDQVQSIYTLVSRLEEKAKAILVQLTKTSANGNIPTTGSTKKKNNFSVKNNNKSCCNSTVTIEPSEEEKLAALGSQGFLAACDNDQSPSTSQQPPRSHSPSAGNLDCDQSLAQTYKDTLKDLQFLSCDIEVEGASAHHFSTHVKKALPPNSAQVIRIAQEMAALSTSLPLDLGSAIFIRTDDAKCTLLRALIIGPEGTPYSGGCFQFDSFFPPQYPTSPPLVHFCTTGLGQVCFNPNLYACGMVCLSSLGTWKGLQGEHWNETSTPLQVKEMECDDKNLQLMEAMQQLESSMTENMELKDKLAECEQEFQTLQDTKTKIRDDYLQVSEPQTDEETSLSSENECKKKDVIEVKLARELEIHKEKESEIEHLKKYLEQCTSKQNQMVDEERAAKEFAEKELYLIKEELEKEKSCKRMLEEKIQNLEREMIEAMKKRELEQKEKEYQLIDQINALKKKLYEAEEKARNYEKCEGELVKDFSYMQVLQDIQRKEREKEFYEINQELIKIKKLYEETQQEHLKLKEVRDTEKYNKNKWKSCKDVLKGKQIGLHYKEKGKQRKLQQKLHNMEMRNPGRRSESGSSSNQRSQSSTQQNKSDAKQGNSPSYWTPNRDAPE